jgi:uncharacterized protein
MVDALTIVAIGVLIGGVLGAILPMVPSSPFSLAGVLLYWWASGYTDPRPIVLVGLLGLGVLSLIVEYAGGAVSAKAGGAATRTVVLAAGVGIGLLFVAGPLGLLAGVAGVVFLGEFYRHRDPRQSLRAALYATIGVLASSVVQTLVAATILVGFLVAVVL